MGQFVDGVLVDLADQSLLSYETVFICLPNNCLVVTVLICWPHCSLHVLTMIQDILFSRLIYVHRVSPKMIKKNRSLFNLAKIKLALYALVEYPSLTSLKYLNSGHKSADSGNLVDPSDWLTGTDLLCTTNMKKQKSSTAPLSKSRQINCLFASPHSMALPLIIVVDCHHHPPPHSLSTVQTV